MSQIIKDLFKETLLKEAEGDVFRSRDIGEREPASDSFPEDEDGSFESGLEPEGDPTEFETEGLGFDPTQVDEDNFAEAYERVEQIDQMIKDLVDPKIDNNLTRVLSKYDRADSIGNGVVQQLKKPIVKASLALSEVKIILNQIASMEDSLKKRVEAIQAKG